MTIKTQFTVALQAADQKCTKAKARIWDICQNPDYTEDGKRRAVAAIQNEMSAYIADELAKVDKAVNDKVGGLNAFEESRQRARNADAGYQSLLAATLQMLPDIAESATADDLRERLAMFADDPVAIAGIRTILKKSAGNGKGLDALASIGVLPEDTRGKKQARLQKLQNTMHTHLEAAMVTVNDTAYRGGPDANTRTIRGGSYAIQSTLDYIEACNDDCTEYDQSKRNTNTQTGQTFDFGFQRIR